jgi:hypothetical protein
VKNGLHIDANGTKRWWLNGKFHREDGPAVEYADGDKAWYLNGKEITIRPMDAERLQKIMVML